MMEIRWVSSVNYPQQRASRWPLIIFFFFCRIHFTHARSLHSFFTHYWAGMMAFLLRLRQPATIVRVAARSRVHGSQSQSAVAARALHSCQCLNTKYPPRDAQFHFKLATMKPAPTESTSSQFIHELGLTENGSIGPVLTMTVRDQFTRSSVTFFLLPFWAQRSGLALFSAFLLHSSLCFPLCFRFSHPVFVLEL